MTDKKSNFERLAKVLADQLGKKVEDIKMTSTFKDLGADSLDMTEAVMAIETEFAIEIPDDDVDAFKTVEDIVNFINRRQVEPPGS